MWFNHVYLLVYFTMKFTPKKVLIRSASLNRRYSTLRTSSAAILFDQTKSLHWMKSLGDYGVAEDRLARKFGKEWHFLLVLTMLD